MFHNHAAQKLVPAAHKPLHAAQNHMLHKPYMHHTITCCPLTYVQGWSMCIDNDMLNISQPVTTGGNGAVVSPYQLAATSSSSAALGSAPFSTAQQQGSAPFPTAQLQQGMLPFNPMASAGQNLTVAAPLLGGGGSTAPWAAGPLHQNLTVAAPLLGGGPAAPLTLPSSLAAGSGSGPAQWAVGLNAQQVACVTRLCDLCACSSPHLALQVCSLRPAHVASGACSAPSN